jgi:hypothetical protein
MAERTIDAVILSREDLLAEVAGALEELRDKLAGSLVMTHGDPDKELSENRNRLFVVAGVHIDAESGCLQVAVRAADPTYPTGHECLLTPDLRERAGLGAGVFLIVMEKEYAHKDYWGRRMVYGVMPVPAASRHEAEALVDRWLEPGRADVLKCCDPRIVWDDERVEEGDWEYIDFSFDRFATHTQEKNDEQLHVRPGQQLGGSDRSGRACPRSR